MLVRLAADSVRVLRVERVERAFQRPFQRAQRALPGPRDEQGREQPQPAYACEEPAKRCDARTAQQAVEAYRAADLVQPRPGLFLHVQA